MLAFGPLIQTSNFWFTYIANVFLVFGPILGILGWGLRRLDKRHERNWADLVEQHLSPRFKALEEKLAKVEAQQLPNGGKSLRDAIDRIDNKTDELNLTLRAHIAYHEGLNAAER